MKMLNDIYFCADCHQNLLLESELHWHEWRLACQFEALGDIRYIYSFESVDEVLRSLEMKGYVISTEAHERFIKIKPRGLIQINSTSIGYCINPNEHKK